MKGSHPRPADLCPFVLGHSISQVTSFMQLGMLWQNKCPRQCLSHHNTTMFATRTRSLSFLPCYESFCFLLHLCDNAGSPYFPCLCKMPVANKCPGKLLSYHNGTMFVNRTRSMSFLPYNWCWASFQYKEYHFRHRDYNHENKTVSHKTVLSLWREFLYCLDIIFISKWPPHVWPVLCIVCWTLMIMVILLIYYIIKNGWSRFMKSGYLNSGRLVLIEIILLILCS